MLEQLSGSSTVDGSADNLAIQSRCDSKLRLAIVNSSFVNSTHLPDAAINIAGGKISRRSCSGLSDSIASRANE